MCIENKIYRGGLNNLLKGVIDASEFTVLIILANSGYLSQLSSSFKQFLLSHPFIVWQVIAVIKSLQVIKKCWDDLVLEGIS